MGDKYLEPGRRQKIGVVRLVDPNGNERFKIFQGNKSYFGTVAGMAVSDKKWSTEAEAQSYLDLLAKARNWKKV